MLLERMRQCRLNFAEHRYDCEAGIVGEHNATELIITPPAIMPDEAVYRLCFEPGGVSEIIPKMSDGTLAYPLSAAVTATAFCCMTLIGYIGNEQVYKSRMVQLHFCRAADGDADIDPQQPGIVAEVNRNTAARHTHENKPVLDKFAETDGKPTYGGQALGGGAADFIIKMTVTSDDDTNYTVTFCDKTVEQIDAAFNADKNIVLTVTPEDGLYYALPLVYATPGFGYFFESFYDVYLLTANIDKRDGTIFAMAQMPANAIEYSNDVMPTVANVKTALDELVTKSHSPTYYIDLAGAYPSYTCPVAMDDIKAAYNAGYNLVCRFKMGEYTATLPLFVPMPAANTWIFSGSGALADMSFPAQSFTIAITANGVAAQRTFLNQSLHITVGNDMYLYDGSKSVDIAVKPPTQSVTTAGENIALDDNTEYRLVNVSTLTLSYADAVFECWMRLTFAASGTITVTLPADTKYIGAAPDFKNGETWELSFKDKVLAAQKVGEGT
nr:MAG TPA: hypothetical protein [Caudoviricetes sp.]